MDIKTAIILIINMSNINLTTEISSQNENDKRVNTGVVAVIIVLIMLFVVYGLLLFGKLQTDKDIVKVQEEFKTEYESLTVGKGKEIVDFQKRLDTAKDAMTKSKNIKESLEEGEKLMVGGSYLSSYKFNNKDNTITMNCVSDNYNVVAKQILSYKKSDYFSGVAAGKSSYNATKNKINFDINLILK